MLYGGAVPKKTPHPALLHLTSDQYTWVTCAFRGKLFEIPPDPKEPAEEAQYRQDREQRAVRGDLTALADLIRMDSYYLQSAWFVETVRLLRSARCYAKTHRERNHATQGLELLASALCGITPGKGLRGKPPHAWDEDVARCYDLLLPVYKAAKRGRPSGPVNLPYELWRYFDGRDPMPKGVTPMVEGGIIGGRVCLNTPPSFTIPAADLGRLKSERPSVVALEQVMTLLRIGRKREGERDLTWIRKLVAAGRKSMA